MEQYRQEAIKLKLPNVIAWIKDFLESSNQKLMVAVVHRDKCGRLLYNHFGSKIAVIMDGQLTSKQKETTKERFINDPDCRLLIGNILSTGTGTDGLQHVCSNLLYAELDWSPANMSQCTARLDRTGQKEPVTVTYMTVMGSIEDQLARTLDKKSKILASVLDNRIVDDTELLTYMIQNGITEEEADWL
jgi:SNF2 family DNA or RNA helicase